MKKLIPVFLLLSYFLFFSCAGELKQKNEAQEDIDSTIEFFMDLFNHADSLRGIIIGDPEEFYITGQLFESDAQFRSSYREKRASLNIAGNSYYQALRRARTQEEYERFKEAIHNIAKKLRKLRMM